jgi:hypothetical protein
MSEQHKAEIEKLVADGVKAGDEAAKPHWITVGELLIEARQHFPNDDRKFWQWAIRISGRRPRMKFHTWRRSVRRSAKCICNAA